jgi:putative DNA primase/helicase
MIDATVIAINSAQSAPLVLDPGDPMTSARALVNITFTTVEGLRTLHHHRGVFWEWTRSYYRLVNDEVINAKIWAFLDQAKQMKDDHLVPFRPNRNKVADVVAALAAQTQLDSHVFFAQPHRWFKTTTAKVVGIP